MEEQKKKAAPKFDSAKSSKTGDVLTEAERMVFHMINDHVYNHDSITEEEVHEWMTENFMPVLRKELDIKLED